MIKTIITDLLRFFRKPDDRQMKVNPQSKLLFLLTLLVFQLIVTLVIIIPFISEINTVLEVKPVSISNFTLFETVLLSVMISPVIEEVIFRYFLRYQGWKTKFISLRGWSKIFPFFVYVSSMFFGLIHLGNYQNNSILFFLLSPLIVVSQFLGGLILAFIRVRLSLFFSMLFHCIWNLLFVVVFPIIQNAFTETYIEKTPNYTIMIKEELYFDKRKTQTILIDSTDGKIRSLKVTQYSIQKLLDTLYTKNKYYINDFLIDVDFQSPKGERKEAFIKIIEKKYRIKSNDLNRYN